MDTLTWLADPVLVANIQRFFGVEFVKPGTCDQQTQTKRPSLEKLDLDSLSEDIIASRDSQPPSVTRCQHVPSETCAVFDKHSSDRKSTSSRHRGTQSKDVEPNNNGINPIEQSRPGVPNSHKGDLIDDAKVSQNGRYNNGHYIYNINSCDYRKVSDKISDTPSEDKNGSVLCKKPTKPETEHAIRIKYKSLFYLAHFGAFLGNEEFYLTFFPFFVWNLDSLMVRQVSLLWAIVMYLGQAAKDYLRWPRPQCPPVIRLETFYLQEFSMPSTHAMAGTAIPMYLAYLAIVRYQVPFALAATVALLWFSVTCYSRLYLGVHTVLDLIAGTLFAIILLFTFIRYVEDYDLYQQTHPFAPVMVITTALLLCTVFYPKSDKISTKGDAVQIVSSVAGCSLGAWMAYQLDYMHEPEVLMPYEIHVPTLTWILLSLLRFVTGLIVLGVSYLTLKKLTVQSFSYLYGLDVPDKTNPSVMTAYKFITYFSLGYIIFFVIPMMHTWLGIERASLFTEVL